MSVLKGKDKNWNKFVTSNLVIGKKTATYPAWQFLLNWHQEKYHKPDEKHNKEQTETGNIQFMTGSTWSYMTDAVYLENHCCKIG